LKISSKRKLRGNFAEVGDVDFEEWPHSGVRVRIEIDLTTSAAKVTIGRKQQRRV
jgi:hypothetical protein